MLGESNTPTLYVLFLDKNRRQYVSYLTTTEVLDLAGYSRKTLWERRKSPDFPVPIVEGNRLYWDRSEIEEHLASRPRQRLAQYGGDMVCEPTGATT